MNARRVVLGVFAIIGASGCAPTTPATPGAIPPPEISGAISAGFGSVNAVTSRGSGSRSGSLTPRIQFSEISASQDSAGERSEWIRAIVLWRAAPGWMNDKRDPERLRAASEEYRRLRSEAVLTNRTVLGGVTHGTVQWAEMDSHGRVLYVLGKEFEIPERDSALVVMIDDLDGSRGVPRVVGTVYVEGTVPPDALGKWWTSGDTTYSVRPKRSRESVLRDALSQSEIAREFIRPE